MFTNNYASYGCAIYSNNSVKVTNSRFKSNYASYSGVIYSTSILDINKGDFSSNNASNQGGAIYSLGLLNIYGSEAKPIPFTSNTADIGSVIYSENEINLFSKFKFLNNVSGDEKLRINTSLYINITYIANISVTLGNGDNFFNSIYSTNI